MSETGMIISEFIENEFGNDLDFWKRRAKLLDAEYDRVCNSLEQTKSELDASKRAFNLLADQYKNEITCIDCIAYEMQMCKGYLHPHTDCSTKIYEGALQKARQEMSNKPTYEMIFNEFKKNNPDIRIMDYRPCCELFDVPNIDNAIVIWLDGGSKIIYKSQAVGEG